VGVEKRDSRRKSLESGEGIVEDCRLQKEKNKKAFSCRRKKNGAYKHRGCMPKRERLLLLKGKKASNGFWLAQRKRGKKASLESSSSRRKKGFITAYVPPRKKRSEWAA